MRTLPIIFIVASAFGAVLNHISAADTSTAPPTAARVFLKDKLAELDGFKNDPNFHDVGFGGAGPYKKWLDSVNEKRNEREWAVLERAAVGHLWQLGQEYRKSKGEETQYSKFARKEILAVIEGTAK